MVMDYVGSSLVDFGDGTAMIGDHDEGSVYSPRLTLEALEAFVKSTFNATKISSLSMKIGLMKVSHHALNENIHFIDNRNRGVFCITGSETPVFEVHDFARQLAIQRDHHHRSVSTRRSAVDDQQVAVVNAVAGERVTRSFGKVCRGRVSDEVLVKVKVGLAVVVCRAGEATFNSGGHLLNCQRLTRQDREKWMDLHTAHQILYI